MTPSPGPWWLRWLPADARAGVLRRAFIVWGVAAVIALLQSLLSPDREIQNYSNLAHTVDFMSPLSA